MKTMIRAVIAAGIFAFFVLALGRAVDAEAHLIRVQPDAPNASKLERRLARQTENLKHAVYVCRNGDREHKRWACWAASSVIDPRTGQGWLRAERRETMNLMRPKLSTAARMILAAEAVKAASPDSDPWPNCPDPHDGSGASWTETVKCENRGIYESAGLAAAWRLDPPGYYCGPLQLDPVIWRKIIARYGVPCDG
jgi:hypothetical protein